MENKSNIYEVQEFHRGKWIAVLSKDKDGKEVKKTVRITQETADAMNVDANADIKSKAKRTEHFRYVKIGKVADAPSGLPSYAEQKVILKEAGVEFKSNAKKAELEEIYKNHLATLPQDTGEAVE